MNSFVFLYHLMLLEFLALASSVSLIVLPDALLLLLDPDSFSAQLYGHCWSGGGTSDLLLASVSCRLPWRLRLRMRSIRVSVRYCVSKAPKPAKSHIAACRSNRVSNRSVEFWIPPEDSFSAR